MMRAATDKKKSSTSLARSNASVNLNTGGMTTANRQTHEWYKQAVAQSLFCQTTSLNMLTQHHGNGFVEKSVTRLWHTKHGVYRRKDSNRRMDRFCLHGWFQHVDRMLLGILEEGLIEENG